MELTVFLAYLKTAGILGSLVFASVGIVKRFITDKNRKVANPALACGLGILYAFVDGGVTGAINILLYGFSAMGSAMLAHSVPKKVAKQLNFQV